MFRQHLKGVNMAAEKKALVSPTNELRVDLPPKLMEVFAQSPRIVIKGHPAGLWPVDPAILKKIDLAKLIADKDFNANFEVVIMQR